MTIWLSSVYHRVHETCCRTGSCTLCWLNCSSIAFQNFLLKYGLDKQQWIEYFPTNFPENIVSRNLLFICRQHEPGRGCARCGGGSLQADLENQSSRPLSDVQVINNVSLGWIPSTILPRHKGYTQFKKKLYVTIVPQQCGIQLNILEAS
jgi:hypothetical protein